MVVDGVQVAEDVFRIAGRDPLIEVAIALQVGGRALQVLAAEGQFATEESCGHAGEERGGKAGLHGAVAK